MKKTEDILNSTTNNSSDANLPSSGSSIRRNRMLTDTASAPNPTIDHRITPMAASSISVNTISTSDGMNSISTASVKSKTPVEMLVPITLEYLREQKTFCKLQHKQEKESILMKKKHAKEQNVLGEQQSKIMTRMKSDIEKMTRSPITYIGNQRKDLRYEQTIRIQIYLFHLSHLQPFSRNEMSSRYLFFLAALLTPSLVFLGIIIGFFSFLVMVELQWKRKMIRKYVNLYVGHRKSFVVFLIDHGFNQ
jgi:hypothetical protein